MAKPRVHRALTEWRLASAVALVVLLVLAAVLIPIAAPFDAERVELASRLMRPFHGSHLLGTDGLGRDMFARVAIGIRSALLLSALAVTIGGVIGTSLGVLAAWFPRSVDPVVRSLADAQLAFPFIVLAIVIGAGIGAGVTTTVIVLAAWVWPLFARLARAEAMSHLRRDYVAAARALGVHDWTIAWRHVLPNIAAPLIVAFFISVPEIIIAESTLSFLGVGIPPTTPTLGTMIAEGRDVIQVAWWVSGVPTLALLAAVLILNRLGVALDRARRGREA